MIRLGVLGSTRGSSLQPVIDAIREKRLSASIEIIISNKSDALILERAKDAAIPFQFIDGKGWTREAFDQQVTTLLRYHRVDLIVLVGYMRILSAGFIRDWKNKIINVHPSLLPAFAGKMDLDVHRAVLEAHLKETGCTVHIVTEEVDAGPIVVQKKCNVLAGDTPETLKARVQAIEGEALIEAIAGLRPSLRGA
jgi:phosphoribosylglycinamide formyltransferase-1